MIPSSFDVLGNIAILKFDEGVKKSEKVKVAREMLKKHKSIKTILEKSGNVYGRLRKIKTNYLAGEKKKIAEYKENGCLFRFDVEETYFSPRLSNERKEIAMQVKKGEKVLVMFAGVAPFSIVIGKLSDASVIYSVEINRKASKFAEENVRLNKLVDKVKVVQGDVKKVVPRFVKQKLKFSRVVMPRANLCDTFLQEAFKVVKKNSMINYYGFSRDHEEILKTIETEAKKARKKIKILKVKKAGDIAPFKYRWRVDLRVES